VRTDSTERKNRVKARHLLIAPLLSFAVAAASAATPPASPLARPAEPAAHTPSIKETRTAVNQISHELKLIDARLGKLEQSLAGVDASLKPVGAIAQPAALRELILLAAACGAGLIVLHALLRRWSNRTAAPAARKE
jgi:septal ring factor EnvC (AmiA/AmiB activator)